MRLEKSGNERGIPFMPLWRDTIFNTRIFQTAVTILRVIIVTELGVGPNVDILPLTYLPSYVFSEQYLETVDGTPYIVEIVAQPVP